MTEPFPKTAHGFVLARDARALGRQAELASAVRSGQLEVVRRGVYMAPIVAPAEREIAKGRAANYRRQVLAASEVLRSPVFTSYSAIALHGLPIIGHWPKQVFVLAPDTHGYRRSTTVGIARLDEVPLTKVGDLVVTSLEHSLIQLCRHAAVGPALVAVEAALAAMPWSDAPPLTTIERLRVEHARLRPYPHARKVEAVLTRASSLSATPIETCSKLCFEEFGFPPPVQQHAIWLPEQRLNAHLDFYWPDFDAAGEADGDVKYLGQAVPDDAVRVVVEEKKREEAVRRRVRALDRWDWTEMWRRHPLVRRLVGLGLPGGTRRLRLF